MRLTMQKGGFDAPHGSGDNVERGVKCLKDESFIPRELQLVKALAQIARLLKTGIRDLCKRRPKYENDKKTVLEAGVAILDPALTPHGFVFRFEDAGCSSGGSYAWGQYVRDDRSLHLHHRLGLGIIEYRIGDLCIGHEDYLKFLGVENQSELLWTPLESGLDRYRALHSDLERFCSDFVLGRAVDWTAAATADGQRRAEQQRQYQARCVGDDRKRQSAHELFREGPMRMSSRSWIRCSIRSC